MNKKILKIILISLIILNILIPLTFGANLNTSIETIKGSEIKNLDNNQGTFTKNLQNVTMTKKKSQ